MPELLDRIILPIVLILGLPIGMLAYERMVPRRASRLRPSPLFFGIGVWTALLAGVGAGHVVSALIAGDESGSVNYLILTACVSAVAALILWYALTVRTYIRRNSLIFQRWLRPTIEVTFSEIAGADITWIQRYRLRLTNGRVLGLHLTTAGLMALHQALKEAGKAVPDDAALARAIAAANRG